MKKKNLKNLNNFEYEFCLLNRNILFDKINIIFFKLENLDHLNVQYMQTKNVLLDCDPYILWIQGIIHMFIMQSSVPTIMFKTVFSKLLAFSFPNKKIKIKYNKSMFIRRSDL